MSVSIIDLPREIFANILISTDGYTLGKCRRVCSGWKDFIDQTDILWERMCMKDFKCSSQIAKRKSGNDCKWYYIYRNLKLWCDSIMHVKRLKEFYKFNVNTLEVSYGVLPVRDLVGTVLFDTTTLKIIPITLPERNCVRIANNDKVTVVLLSNSKILIQRTIESTSYTNEAVFNAENFALSNDYVYYYMNNYIYKCNLQSPNLSSMLIVNCEYQIANIEHNNEITCIFTKCKKFLNILKDNTIVIKPVTCPKEWLPQLKNVYYFNEKNYISYSRNLFILHTEKALHTYINFPPIASLFFYGDIVLIGTRNSEIFLYKPFDKKKTKHTEIYQYMSLLVKLPDNKIPMKIDVCERKSGSLILVMTSSDLFTIDINISYNDAGINTSRIYSKTQIDMYKRLLKIKERLDKTTYTVNS
ncbi:uncharacterized protein LOC121738012 [Aricia agestis]|uniref:uncharacterized protein LOC121738012 n=1 Tax=Aricia agestis TaxID=91739 RepID=UPI001C201BE8|nr:uncharacterized protein LOC121738012 [Aricia agestis]